MRIIPKCMTLLSLMIIFAVIMVDQISKYWIGGSLNVGQIYSVCPWLNFYLAYNTGAAFSIFSHANGWQVYGLAGLGILICIVMMMSLLFQKSVNYWRVLAISLIIGGAIGNLIDRIRLGYVIDFIDFHVGHWHYATFNVADSAITIGVMMLIVLLLLKKEIL